MRLPSDSCRVWASRQWARVVTDGCRGGMPFSAAGGSTGVRSGSRVDGAEHNEASSEAPSRKRRFSASLLSPVCSIMRTPGQSSLLGPPTLRRRRRQRSSVVSAQSKNCSSFLRFDRRRHHMSSTGLVQPCSLRIAGDEGRRGAGEIQTCLSSGCCA